ncbi:MAG: DUF4838 domain-containing protein [Chitinophagaceae bacterium]|nr:DUF4838 domain-containing protein [Chitinophagaceae bacterium]
MRFFLLLFSVFAISSCSMNHYLIKNGQSKYKIFVSKNAIASEKYAAEELQKYLYEISGCKLRIVHQSEGKDRIIYVGFKGAPASVMRDIKPENFGSDEYIISSEGKDLLIAGGETRGTLYGVVGYLSDHLGCRWYTKDVSKIPIQKSISFPKIKDHQKPAFEYRDMDWPESRDTLWSVHNRINGTKVSNKLGGSYITYPFVHTYYQLVPPEKYFSSHPQYFSLVNGKRVGKDAQLCITNPEVVKVATQTVFDWIQTYPEANVYSIDPNDGKGYCECERCVAMDEKYGSRAGTLLYFVNQIAEAVAKKHPHKMLQTLAYAYTVDPPKDILPAENVMIRLCHYEYCSSHPIEDCQANEPFYKIVNQWKELAPGRLTVWDYFNNFRNLMMPFPDLNVFSPDIKFYVNNGVKGLFCEGNPYWGGEFAELRSWVLAQLMWNPEKDGQTLINEFVDGVYGAAASYISEYIRLLHGQVMPDMHLNIFAQPWDVNYLKPDFIKKTDSLFAQASMQVKGNKEWSEEVEWAYLPVLWVKLHNFSDGGADLIKREEVSEAVTRFRNEAKQRKIEQLVGNLRLNRETTEGFIDEVQTVLKTEFYTDWQIIGPFENKDYKGLITVFPPEIEINQEKVYRGADEKEVSWKNYSDSSNGFVNFNNVFDCTPAVAYAYKVIESSENSIQKFTVGNTMNGIKIWINGNLVFQRLPREDRVPNRFYFDTRLQKGENKVLIKVDWRGKRRWGFHFGKVNE